MRFDYDEQAHSASCRELSVGLSLGANFFKPEFGVFLKPELGVFCKTEFGVFYKARVVVLLRAMAKQERMKHLPGLSETLESVKLSEGGNSDSMQKLQFHMTHLKECKEAVQDQLSSCKFNKKQCEYLAGKLEVAVQDASSFIEEFRAKRHGPCSSEDVENIFKLVLALAKQIEGFVKRCGDPEWIQAAMKFTNVSEYATSLGFNVQLCKLAFQKARAALFGERSVIRGFTFLELCELYKTEEEIVQIRASEDLYALRNSVTRGLTSFNDGETKDIAIYLLQRLSGGEPCATSEDEGRLQKLFKFVIRAGKQLGRGATGTVYEAKWLGMPVAKKTFDDSTEREAFMEEVRTLSRLHHPNIMSMFCYEKKDRSCSIIMELMDEDLHRLLRRKSEEKSGSPPFHILESVDIMLQVGEGVHYLHSKHIVHRDLKSQNILVKCEIEKESKTQSIHAKVSDFGLSKIKDSTVRGTELTANTGTNRWMPPEVINFKTGSRKVPFENNYQLSYPFKCDTYSFAMVCYEVLTGYLPFEKEKYNEPRIMKEKIREGIRPKLPEDPKECPPMLKALIERCWSQEPKERPRLEFVCSQLRFLKYLLMTGADQEAHLAAAKELDAAAAEARKAEEAREQEAASKLLEAQKQNDALSPIEQEARDARDRKRELELASEALAQKAAARSRVKDVLVALRQGRRPVVGSSTDEMTCEWARFTEVNLKRREAARERIQYERGKCHVAVCGTSGSGKSSLINAFCGVRPRDASAARVGVTETTLEVTRYPDPRSELPYSRFVWYDLPGAGTVAVSNGQYFETQELFAYNCIIIMYGERFTNIVDILEKCAFSLIPTFIVRSKADQLIGNMIQDETDASPYDDDYDEIYQEFKCKYIDATKSDFDMHKEVMAEVLFEGYPWVQSKLLRQHVYMVSAANVRSLMQAGVEKGGGASKSKNIDEALLVEDVLRMALGRFFSVALGPSSKNHEAYIKWHYSL